MHEGYLLAGHDPASIETFAHGVRRGWLADGRIVVLYFPPQTDALGLESFYKLMMQTIAEWPPGQVFLSLQLSDYVEQHGISPAIRYWAARIVQETPQLQGRIASVVRDAFAAAAAALLAKSEGEKHPAEHRVFRERPAAITWLMEMIEA